MLFLCHKIVAALTLTLILISNATAIEPLSLNPLGETASQKTTPEMQRVMDDIISIRQLMAVTDNESIGLDFSWIKEPEQSKTDTQASEIERLAEFREALQQAMFTSEVPTSKKTTGLEESDIKSTSTKEERSGSESAESLQFSWTQDGMELSWTKESEATEPDTRATNVEAQADFRKTLENAILAAPKLASTKSNVIWPNVEFKKEWQQIWRSDKPRFVTPASIPSTPIPSRVTATDSTKQAPSIQIPKPTVQYATPVHHTQPVVPYTSGGSQPHYSPYQPVQVVVPAVATDSHLHPRVAKHAHPPKMQYPKTHSPVPYFTTPSITPHRAHPNPKKPSKKEVLRNTAWELERKAQEYECLDMYFQADKLRELAADFRQVSRKH